MSEFKLNWETIEGGHYPQNYACQSGLTFTETERAEIQGGYLLRFTVRESFYDNNMKAMGWKIISQQITAIANG